MTSVTVRAHAKINFNLELTGRTSDGYHLLESVAQTVSLHDILDIEATPRGIDVEVDDPERLEEDVLCGTAALGCAG